MDNPCAQTEAMANQSLLIISMEALFQRSELFMISKKEMLF
jgi:hypothetical protein